MAKNSNPDNASPETDEYADSCQAPIAPQPYDFYIGRLLVGSERVVTELRRKFVPREVISSQNRLVLPYMYRRALADRSDANVALRKALNALRDHSPRAAATEIKFCTVKPNINGGEYTVRLAYGSPDYEIMRNETSRVIDSINETTGLDLRPQTLILRAYSTPSETRAHEAAGLIDTMFRGAHILSPPSICEAAR